MLTLTILIDYFNLTLFTLKFLILTILTLPLRNSNNVILKIEVCLS